MQCTHNAHLHSMIFLPLLAILLLRPVGGVPDPQTRAFCLSLGFSSAEKAHGFAMGYAMKGSYAESLWGFRRACELATENSFWWNDLGVTLLRLQRLSSADAAFRLALLLDPGHTSAQNNLDECRAHLEAQAKQLSTTVGALLEGGKVLSTLVGARGEVALALGGQRGEEALALAHNALALDERERLILSGREWCAGALEEALVRLAPPLNASSLAAFKAATGIRHSVARLPRIERADIDLPANADYKAGRKPYILKGSIGRRHEALRRASDPRALASGPWAGETADFYPESMVEHTVHPFLIPLSRALGELAEPTGDFTLPTSPRGGRYMHLNMGSALWRDYLASLHPFTVPQHLDTPSAWLEEALGEPLATDFQIGNHWRMLLVGSEGAGMFSHQDILKTASYQLQVGGVKTWHICAPSESPYLDVNMDMFAPDYARFPGALQATCYLDAVVPGDIIFYPADYWHQTLNTPLERGELVFSITDTLVDANNYALVEKGLRDKCLNPTPFNRGGMIKEVCEKMPRLYTLWGKMFAGKEEEAGEEED